MQVVFIYGPAASGKHTIGSLVAEELGIPLFHNHLTVDLALALFDFGTTPFRALRASIWSDAFRAAAEVGRSFVFTFHPEATVDPALVDGLIGTIEDAGGSVLLVELVCPRETVLERLDSESRHAFGKMTDRDLYEEIESRGGFEFAGLGEADLQVDTSRHTPSESMRIIVAEARARAGR